MSNTLKLPLESLKLNVDLTGVEFPEALSSAPGGELPLRRGFWFGLNAELVLYGATEPDAKVTIAGRLIQLQTDGSFSCRFALPDGDYELVVAAVSATQDEQRQVQLKFSRRTEYRESS